MWRSGSRCAATEARRSPSGWSTSAGRSSASPRTSSTIWDGSSKAAEFEEAEPTSPDACADCFTEAITYAGRTTTLVAEIDEAAGVGERGARSAARAGRGRGGLTGRRERLALCLRPVAPLGDLAHGRAQPAPATGTTCRGRTGDRQEAAAPSRQARGGAARRCSRGSCRRTRAGRRRAATTTGRRTKTPPRREREQDHAQTRAIPDERLPERHQQIERAARAARRPGTANARPRPLVRSPGGCPVTSACAGGTAAAAWTAPAARRRRAGPGAPSSRAATPQPEVLVLGQPVAPGTAPSATASSALEPVELAVAAHPRGAPVVAALLEKAAVDAELDVLHPGRADGRGCRSAPATGLRRRPGSAKWDAAYRGRVGMQAAVGVDNTRRPLGAVGAAKGSRSSWA